MPKGKAQPKVLVVMGSRSDVETMREATTTLDEFGIPFEVRIASAHRSPAWTAKLAESAVSRGIKVIIAGAGGAAHLAGVMAAHTTLPVVGVPLPSSPLHGVDSLYSTVQMPAGVPVATMGVGAAGARNAGILAAQILALSDVTLAKKLAAFKNKLSAAVEEQDSALR